MARAGGPTRTERPPPSALEAHAAVHLAHVVRHRPRRVAVHAVAQECTRGARFGAARAASAAGPPARRVAPGLRGRVPRLARRAGGPGAVAAPHAAAGGAPAHVARARRSLCARRGPPGVPGRLRRRRRAQRGRAPGGSARKPGAPDAAPWSGLYAPIKPGAQTRECCIVCRRYSCHRARAGAHATPFEAAPSPRRRRVRLRRGRGRGRARCGRACPGSALGAGAARDVRVLHDPGVRQHLL